MSNDTLIKLQRNLKPAKSATESDIVKHCACIISKARNQIKDCASDGMYLRDFSHLYCQSMKEAYAYSLTFRRKDSNVIYSRLYRSINKIFNKFVFNRIYNDFGQVGLDNAKYMLSIRHIILNNYIRYRLYTLAMIICKNYIHEMEEEDFERLLISLAYGFKVNYQTVKLNTNTWENLLRE